MKPGMSFSAVGFATAPTNRTTKLSLRDIGIPLSKGGLEDYLCGDSVTLAEASGAISNAYYPASDRGPGLTFSTTFIDIAADMANGLIQEFVLRKLTPSAKNQPH